jgi:3-dehydroquinate dehydratase-1
MKNPLLLELKKYPMLVAALDGDDLPFLLEAAKTLRVDMVELRMDVWSHFFREDMLQKLARFKQKIGVPMLVSFRGGHPFPSWWQPLHWRALASVDMIDVEWDPKYPWKEIRAQTQSLNLGLMISHHDYDKTPSLKALQALSKAAVKQGAQIVKIATKIKSEEDIRTLLDVNRSLSPKTLGTVMGMGAWATVSRLVAPLFGSCLVYGFIGSATAIGQSPYKELQERMRSLNPRYEEGFQARQKKRGLL